MQYKKRLIRSALPFTHRDVPLQIGLNSNTYENMLMQNGEIETHDAKFFPDYTYNHDIDNMEWRLKDQMDQNSFA